jgi:hypothetical protein
MSVVLASGTYTIRQKSSGRLLDAYETADKDFGLVTRPAQNNDTQRWLILPAPGGSFKFRQLSSNRFVDAYQSAEDDFSAVTRKHQHNDTQRWLFDPA